MENNNLLFIDDSRARYPGRRFLAPVYPLADHYFQRNFVQHHRLPYKNEYKSLGLASKSNKNFKKKGQYPKKKKCSCKNTQCLKLYCKCFANGEFCLNCNCKGCHNTINSINRSKAIKSTLERNPKVFDSKIGVGKIRDNTNVGRVHVSGCQCKKSNCMNNYCECYKANVACSDRCKCTTCRNTEIDRESIMYDTFPMMNDWDKSSLNSHDEASDESIAMTKIFPWMLLTDSVVEATSACLLTRASDSIKNDGSQIQTINEICEEFGNALTLLFDANQKLEKSNETEKESTGVL
uniref:CRC domain-containing protein n=1 Tax=Panagrolaimus sp. PS1159 TaxID=55785 RepID=A0AC35GAC6_9BILA